MFGSNDITWCMSKCSNTECFRNPIHLKDKVGLHSYADLKDTIYCQDIKVTTQERGWAGHFICCDKCSFRRNTLVTCGDIKWIVSTVGAMRSSINIPELNIKVGQIQEIRPGCWYETMAFESTYDEYDDADVSKRISFEHDWGIFGDTWEDIEQKYGKDVDNVANNMHDEIVEEIKLKIKEAYINAKTSNTI